MRLRSWRWAVPVLACVAIVCAPVGASAKKPARVKCRHGTVPVKIQHKTTCRSVRQALPRPRTGDPRVALSDALLAMNFAFLRDRHGHRLPPLSKLAGGRPYRTVVHNLPTALARLDRLAFPHGRPAAARLASGSCRGQAPAVSSSSASIGEGSSMSLDTSSNGTSTVTMTTTAPGGLHITVQFQVSECDHFDVPSCPTADGRLDGTDSSPLLFSTTITQNGKLLRSDSVEIEDTQKLAGQVADDAKLDTLDISDSYSFRDTFAGSQHAQAISLTGRVELQTRVDMRSGLYVPGHGGVTVNATVDGASVSDADLASLASQSEAEANAAFAKVASKEIARYHARETSIDKAGACAQLTFKPVRDTVTLNSGDQGHFTGRIESKEGGDASKARWTLSAQKNASFSPSSTENPQPSFSYDVSGSPSSNTFSTHVKATSTAGVAEEDWTQKLKTLKTISGTFTGRHTDGSGKLSWSGTATFQRADSGVGIAGSFQLTTGQATVTASGTDASGCSVSGSATVTLQTNSVWGVQGDKKPYTYQIIAEFKPPDTVPVTLSGCPDVGADGPSTVAIGAPAIQSGDLVGGLDKTSADGLTYNGSASASFGLDPGESESWTWSMTGTIS